MFLISIHDILFRRYDIHTRSYKNSIRLLGDNDDEFSSTSTNKPTVEIDGCKVSSRSLMNPLIICCQLHLHTNQQRTITYLNFYYRYVKVNPKRFSHYEPKNEVNFLQWTSSQLIMVYHIKHLALKQDLCALGSIKQKQ